MTRAHLHRIQEGHDRAVGVRPVGAGDPDPVASLPVANRNVNVPGPEVGRP